MDVNKELKPLTITWSDEIQEKMRRRGITILNRQHEPRRFTTNKTIMDMVVEYVKETNKGNEIITPINQVRIMKRMRLPCE